MLTTERRVPPSNALALGSSVRDNYKTYILRQINCSVIDFEHYSLNDD